MLLPVNKFKAAQPNACENVRFQLAVSPTLKSLLWAIQQWHDKCEWKTILNKQPTSNRIHNTKVVDSSDFLISRVRNI